MLVAGALFAATTAPDAKAQYVVHHQPPPCVTYVAPPAPVIVNAYTVPSSSSYVPSLVTYVQNGQPGTVYPAPAPGEIVHYPGGTVVYSAAPPVTYSFGAPLPLSASPNYTAVPYASENGVTTMGCPVQFGTSGGHFTQGPTPGSYMPMPGGSFIAPPQQQNDPWAGQSYQWVNRGNYTGTMGSGDRGMVQREMLASNLVPSGVRVLATHGAPGMTQAPLPSANGARAVVLSVCHGGERDSNGNNVAREYAMRNGVPTWGAIGNVTPGMMGRLRAEDWRVYYPDGSSERSRPPTNQIMPVRRVLNAIFNH